jgi:hypothetical protein
VVCGQNLTHYGSGVQPKFDTLLQWCAAKIWHIIAVVCSQNLAHYCSGVQPKFGTLLQWYVVKIWLIIAVVCCQNLTHWSGVQPKFDTFEWCAAKI